MSTTTRSPSNPVRAEEASSERPSQRLFLGLSGPQVIGSALAAATSAVAASFLGVAGTLIGAVVGSLVATIGGAVYSHSLVLAASQLRVVRVAGQPDSDGTAPNGASTGLLDEQAAPDDDASPAEEAGHTTTPRERRWLRLTVGLALGVVLALAAITVVELVIGHPISGSTSSGTSIGQAVSGSQHAGSSSSLPASSSSVPSTRPAPTSTATGSVTSGAAAQTATTGGASPTASTGTGSANPTSPAAQTASPGQPAG